jgi:hypothetical protein
MNSTTESNDLTSTSAHAPVRLRYYALLFAGVLWGSVFGLSALKVYGGIQPIKSGPLASLLVLLIAAFTTTWAVTSRVTRALTGKEVVRLTTLCFLVHWAQDEFLPFVYRWNTHGPQDFDPLVKAVTLVTAFGLTWIALAVTNQVVAVRYTTSSVT